MAASSTFCLRSLYTWSPTLTYSASSHQPVTTNVLADGRRDAEFAPGNHPRRRTRSDSGFGGASLLLAIGGIAGVTLQSVGSRRREIGIRMALGAGGHDLVMMVVRENMKFAAIGLACGMALSYFAVRVIASLLFQTDSLDPLTFAIVAAAVPLLAGLASWLPARRAAGVDPVIALSGD